MQPVRHCSLTGRCLASPNAVGMTAARPAQRTRHEQRTRGTGINLPASETLTADQKANVASMVEEEKLAHDVYVALAAKFPADFQFARIANSGPSTRQRCAPSSRATTSPTPWRVSPRCVQHQRLPEAVQRPVRPGHDGC